MLKIVGILLSVVLLCGIALAFTSGEYALAVALAVIPCVALVYRKLFQLEGRIQALEKRSSDDARQPQNHD